MNVRTLLKSIGPGILFAGAAIGASHIIQSTRAGASYGYGLLIFVVLSNLIKYPFFEYGQRYTASTGESIIQGYSRLGKIQIILFFVLNHFTSVISTAGVTLVTAALSSHLLNLFFGVEFVDITQLSTVILITVILMLVLGKYTLLDKVVKVLIVLLSISTLIAFILTFMGVKEMDPNFVAPEVLTTASYGFLIALMGWMPAPIESSSWTSEWMIERTKETGHKPSLNESLIDFKIGYIGTAILACLFLGLGANVMFGTGQEFSSSAIQFTKQVITLYTDSFGNWSLPLISIVTLVTMASTTMTVVDAYPRAIARCISIFTGKANEKFWYITYLVLISAVGLIIISYFTNRIKAMIDFATTISFLAAPIFSYLNFSLVTSSHINENDKPGKSLRILSVVGLIFLICFSLFFIVLKYNEYVSDV